MAFTLDKAEYEYIADQLVLSNQNNPSATRRVTLRTNARDIPPSYSRNDFSLTRQLDELTCCEQYRPDAYYFTVRSAIPIADVVRGFYAERRLDLPPLRPVHANWTLSRSGENSKEAVEEQERLRLEVGDIEHAAIIDQFIDTGATITYASHLLLRSGVKRVTAIPGCWYEDIHEGHEVIAAMTSKHRNFLFKVGQACAQARDQPGRVVKARQHLGFVPASS